MSISLSGCTWTFAVDTITFEGVSGSEQNLMCVFYVWNVGLVLKSKVKSWSWSWSWSWTIMILILIYYMINVITFIINYFFIIFNFFTRFRLETYLITQRAHDTLLSTKIYWSNILYYLVDSKWSDPLTYSDSVRFLDPQSLPFSLKLNLFPPKIETSLTTKKSRVHGDSSH